MNQMPPRPGCSLVCTNARGLTPSKLAHHLLWLKENRVDIAVLTETQTASSPEALLRQQPGAGAIWPGASFHSCPGNGRTEGIVVILAPHCPLASTTVRELVRPSGRILVLEGVLFGTPSTLVCVYAPAQPVGRARFFSEELGPALPADDRPMMLVGDFNCILDPADVVVPPDVPPPCPRARTQGSQALRQIMDTRNLRDIWRTCHPDCKDFTHWQPAAISGARLDRWLVSDSLLLQCSHSSSSILSTPGFSSDHRPVQLLLRPRGAPFPRGSGLLGFPLLMLNIPEACNELRNTIAAEALLMEHLPDSDIVLAWDNFKETIRMKAVSLYKLHRKTRARAAHLADVEARNAIHALRYATGATLPALKMEATMKLAAATKAWQELGDKPLQAASLLDHTFGDSSSYYFHQLARSPHPPVMIEKLRHPGHNPADEASQPADLSSRAGVGAALSYACAFYSADSPTGLFRPRADINEEAQQTLLDALPGPLPPYYADLAEGTDGDSRLHAFELHAAIRAARRGAAPGHDGIPYEFYNAFREELTPILLRVFNAAFEDTSVDAPLAPLLRGVICLVHKDGQPVDQLTGYRPITLLNCDAKLVMAIIANRLQRPLDYVINITQSAFLRGRDICDNVRFHLGLASRLRQLGLPGWLLHSDLTKAYDRADRGWLLKTMTTMGFRNVGVVRWSGLFLRGTTSAVRINGFLTPFFPNASGLPQGSALSCTQWVLLFEPFLAYLNRLQANGRLGSFEMPSGLPAPAVLTFADDSKSFVLDPEVDGKALKDAYALAASAGLPEQSIAKTKLLLLHLPPGADIPPMLDPQRQHHDTTGYALHPHASPHRLLGVPFGPPPEVCCKAAFSNMDIKIARTAAPWTQQALNAFGRSHVAMQCLASKLLYQSNFSAPPPAQLYKGQRAIERFVATPLRAEEVSPIPGNCYPRAAVASLPIHRGGLGLPHLPTHMQAMISKTCWQLFRFSEHPWQALFQHEVAQAVLHTPGIPPGFHALVTAPEALQLGGIQSKMLRDSCNAFKRLRVRRLSPLEPTCPRSILMELTFNPYPPPDCQPIIVEDMVSAEAVDWVRLRDVRDAVLHRQDLPETAVQDLDLILSRLPPQWSQVVHLVDLPECDWRIFTAAADFCSRPVLQGPDPVTNIPRLWELWPSGRLHPLPVDAPSPAGPTKPVLVHLLPKPKYAWLRDDILQHGAQQQLPPGDRKGILEPWMVGSWEDMQLDPRVWGIRIDNVEVNLLTMQVRQARQALFHDYMDNMPPSQRVTGYKEEKAAWPKIWSFDSNDDPNALSGLQDLEQKWAVYAHAPVEQPIDAPDPADLPQFAWLDLQRVRPARPAPGERAPHPQAQPALGPLRPGFSKVWTRLGDKTLHRPFRITCYLLLHGALGCGAFLHSVRRHLHLQPAPQTATCHLQACASMDHLDTLTHSLLDCPASAPVVDWLLETWSQLSGIHLPRSPDLLLADDISHWPGPRPSAALLRLWTVLRVTTLGALWQERTASKNNTAHAHLHDGGASVIRIIVTMVREAIQRDWLRTQLDIRSLDDGAFCMDWWRGMDCSLSTESFTQLWATPPILCEVSGNPAALVLYI